MENEPSGFILPDNPGLTARALLGPLIADAPIGLALVDVRFRYVFINETQAGFNELPVSQHLGKTVRGVLGDDAWKMLAPFFQQSLKGESLRSHEFTTVSPRQPGVRRHYLVSFYPVRSDRRTVTGVGTVITDITERKQNEALIAGQNKILEGIATDAPLLQTMTSLAELMEEQLPNISLMVLWSQSEREHLTVAAAPRLSCAAASRIWERLESHLASTAGDGGCWPQESVVTPLSREVMGGKFPEDNLFAALFACWMVPVHGEKDELIGAFGVLFPEARSPTPRERRFVESAVPTVRIAIERDRELVRRRQLLRDMLGSLTGQRLVLCLSPGDLPAPLPVLRGEAMPLSTEALRDLRLHVSTVAEGLAMPSDRRYDLEAAVGEAAMNAVVHAGTGTGKVFTDLETECVQVWIQDTGTGIAEESLHRATLERGFSTSNTLGYGFWMILNTIDKVYLLTGPEGTTIVLEHGCKLREIDWMHLV